MLSNWTQGLNEVEKEDFTKLLKNSSIVLGRLEEIVQTLDSSVSNQELKEEDYNNPSWAYKQAFRNGQRSAYNKVLKLLKD